MCPLKTLKPRKVVSHNAQECALSGPSILADYSIQLAAYFSDLWAGLCWQSLWDVIVENITESDCGLTNNRPGLAVC